MRTRSVLLACLATLGLHALSLTRELGVDEGGFAMVARFVHGGGPYLYGPEWVDRPPGLIAVFWLAERLGPYGVRAAAALAAVILVASAASAAETLAGRHAARWTAWTAFALSSSVLLQAQRLNGELVAAALVALSVAAVLRAVRGSSRATTRLALGVLGGAAATSAVLMKQNFVDAFVFTTVLLVTGSLTRRNRATYRPVLVVATAAAFVAGAALPAAAAAAWSVDHGGPSALAYAMFGFRADAAAVVARWSFAAPEHRASVLFLLAIGSGLLLILVHLAARHGRRLLGLEPLPWAITATTAVELLGIVAGENFWPHYLIALVPMVSLAVGLGARPRMPGRHTLQVLALGAVASTLAVTPVVAVGSALAPSEAYAVGQWVGTSARPGDTITVPFTHANVINASGLRPAYPYAWSLPVRTLDPHLTLLVHTLDGPRAPTWVVRWDDPDSWGLDPHGRVARTLLSHYRAVASVCGRVVWLHDGVHRRFAPLPACAAS